MTRRTAVTIGGLAVASALSLVAVTNAWFVKVESTPEGEGVTSALVRYLPEEEQRSSESLLTFGNLISGGSIDPEGIPLVLPGDSLLASSYVENGLQTVRTSVARSYEPGDAIGTVITRETHYDGSGDSITRIQRNLMDGPHSVTNWYSGESTAPLPSVPSITGFSAATTSTTTTDRDDTSVGSIEFTVTTVVTVTTTYTKTENSVTTVYRQEQVTTTKVSHEKAAFLPASSTEAAWAGYTARAVTTAETVLAVAEDASKVKTTRSSLLITDTAHSSVSGTAKDPVPIPLRIQNLSTVDTKVRIGLSVVVTPVIGQAYALSIADGGKADSAGKYYFGASESGSFTDLIVLRPGTDWTYNTEESDGTWYLWDLKVGDSDVIPPFEVDEFGTAIPAFYTAIEAFSVAGKPHDSNTATSTFENNFNKLYCTDSPTIEIRLRYYVRQSDYMEWSQFYALDTDLTFGSVVTTTADTIGEGD